MADPERAGTREDVEALIALLTWARREGFWFEAATVGTVQIVGAKDYLPSVKAQAQAAAHHDERARAAVGGGETMYDLVGSDLPGYDAMRGERPE